MKYEIMIFFKFNKFKLYLNDKFYLVRYFYYVSRNGEFYVYCRVMVYDVVGCKLVF